MVREYNTRTNSVVFASFLKNGTLLGKMSKSMLLLQGFKVFFGPMDWLSEICWAEICHKVYKYHNKIFFSLMCSSHYGITCLFGTNNGINNGINTGRKGPTRLVYYLRLYRPGTSFISNLISGVLYLPPNQTKLNSLIQDQVGMKVLKITQY